MTGLDPKEVFQARLDELTGGEREPTQAECDRAYDMMRDDFADMADRYRDQLKERGL
jgi:hypothetical protein